MIKFWTFQSKYTMDELCKSGIYFPDFNKTCQYSGRLPAYNYILNIYNTMPLDTKCRGKRLKGLVFGLTEYQGDNIITYDDYINCIIDFGASGISNCNDDVYVLELQLSNNMFLMPIDFYRFTDLIYYSSEVNNTKELNVCKEKLFSPNGTNNEFELPQCHLPYIDKSFIKNIYPGVSFNSTNNRVYSKCNYLEYYKKKLIIK